jgi:hypothetical protein
LAPGARGYHSTGAQVMSPVIHLVELHVPLPASQSACHWAVSYAIVIHPAPHQLFLFDTPACHVWVKVMIIEISVVMSIHVPHTGTSQLLVLKRFRM